MNIERIQLKGQLAEAKSKYKHLDTEAAPSRSPPAPRRGKTVPPGPPWTSGHGEGKPAGTGGGYRHNHDRS